MGPKTQEDPCQTISLPIFHPSYFKKCLALREQRREWWASIIHETFSFYLPFALDGAFPGHPLSQWPTIVSAKLDVYDLENDTLEGPLWRQPVSLSKERPEKRT